MRIPLNLVGLRSKVDKVREQLEQNFEREPTAEELAEELSIPMENMETFFSVDYNRHISLDAQFSDDNDNSLLDVLPDEGTQEPDALLAHETNKMIVKQLLNVLKHEKEREIMRLIYNLDGAEFPMSLEEIGKKMGFEGKERIRQIKEKCLERIAKSPQARKFAADNHIRFLRKKY